VISERISAPITLPTTMMTISVVPIGYLEDYVVVYVKKF